MNVTRLSDDSLKGFVSFGQYSGNDAGLSVFRRTNGIKYR